MKGKLLVHLEAASHLDKGRAAARVWRVADIDGTPLENDATELLVRAGEDSALEVDLGYFVIDIRWRNGKASRYNCNVLSAVAQKVKVTAPAVGKSHNSVRDFTKPSAGGMFGSTQTHEVFVSDDRLDTWRFVCDRQRIEQQSQLPLTSLGFQRDQDIELSAGSRDERNWVEYWGGDGWAIASLPFSPSRDPDVCVLRSAPEGVPFMATTNPETAVMVDLIPAGNSESMRQYARSTYDELPVAQREALVQSNPIEACAFAYAEHDCFDSSRWIDLLAKAEGHANWLPDLSVILGWRLIMQSQSVEDKARARGMLESAMSAGVPFYAMGLKLLSEALAVLSGDDRDVATAEKMVRAVAMRTVATEAFTTVRP